MHVVNHTLQEIKASDKPIVTIFNKMDLYEAQSFDPWLPDDVKQELLEDLYQKWQLATQGNAIFVSATARKNIDQLRSGILNKVKALYEERYPYLTNFY